MRISDWSSDVCSSDLRPHIRDPATPEQPRTHVTPSHSTPDTNSGELTSSFLGVFRYSRRAVELVWSTSRGLTVALGLLTLVAGLLPAGVAWVGALIIDAVVASSRTVSAGEPLVLAPVLTLIAIAAGLVLALAGAQRGLSLCQSLLTAQLSSDERRVGKGCVSTCISRWEPSH